jgi:hypothetical protein
MIGISYRRDEPTQIAFRLKDRLASEFGEKKIFFDHSSIPSGVDFFEYIKSNFKGCHLILAIIGNTWTGPKDERGINRIQREDDYIRMEIEFAVNNNIKIFPVLIEGCSFPSDDELPESLVFLKKLNYFTISTAERFHDSFEKLLKQLASVGIGRKTPYRSVDAVELQNLCGEWISYSHGGLVDSVLDKLYLRQDLSKIYLHNSPENTEFQYSAECQFISGDFLSGFWWSTLPGSTATGIFIVKLTPHRDVAYGYYSGFNIEGSGKLLSWCWARNLNSLNKAVKLLPNLVLNSS